MKTLDNTNFADVKAATSDVKVFGNGDAWRLMSKASSEAQGWMKSAKAKEIEGVGCLVQVTTQQRNPDGSYAVAEALAFVPGVKLADDEHGGRTLVSA